MIIDLSDNELVYSKLLEVPPMAKQSTNFNARTKRAYTSKRQKNWMFNVSLLASDSKAFPSGKHIIDYPVIAIVNYCFAYTAKFSKRDRELIEDHGGTIPKSSRPDVQDNLNKALFDSLSFLKDDSFVTDIIARKFWGVRHHIHISLYRVNVPQEISHLCHGKA